ncbi:hypothetical protein [Candidatus Endoriftia persephone]|jgi:hypothetical protein|uniref:Uncharacterized protein n=1 Tax=Candidatus Endoriftia persephonae TaxID=393765 RepID=A0A9J7A0C9_9GAMM|nr:hypothetical protein [Candidatus Endoriftia persephone]USF88407.1 hypothetical protein L0Y14_03990 [Candidatus Endoriftia persephone]
MRAVTTAAPCPTAGLACSASIRRTSSPATRPSSNTTPYNKSPEFFTQDLRNEFPLEFFDEATGQFTVPINTGEYGVEVESELDDPDQSNNETSKHFRVR